MLRTRGISLPLPVAFALAATLVASLLSLSVGHAQDGEEGAADPVPPVVRSQARDQADLILFSDRIGPGDFEIVGNPGLHPSVAVAPDGTIAFGDPIARTPSGVPTGAGVIFVVPPFFDDENLTTSGLRTLQGGTEFGFIDVPNDTFFGGRLGDGVGTGVQWSDLNLDGSLDLVDNGPPTEFRLVQITNDPYAGQIVNILTGQRDWYWFTAPGVGMPLAPDDPRIPPTVEFPAGIGTNLRQITLDSGIVQLDAAALDNPAQNQFFGFNQGDATFNAWFSGGSSWGVNPVDPTTGEVDPLVLDLDLCPSGSCGQIFNSDIFSDGFESGDTSAWSNTASELAERRFTGSAEILAAQVGPGAQADGFCATFCVVLATVPAPDTGLASVFVVDLAALPSLGNLDITGDESWARRIDGIPGADDGLSVTVGDLNDDGETDLVIGVPGGRADDLGAGAASQTGVVYVLNGPLETGPLAPRVTRIIVGVDANVGFGGDVAIDDLLITSRNARPGGTGSRSGALTVVLGAPPTIADVSSDGETTVIAGSNLDGVVFIDGARAETLTVSAERVEVLGSGDFIRVAGVFGSAQDGEEPSVEVEVPLQPMWNLSGWRGATAPDVATQSIAGQFRGLFTWDAFAQAFLSYNVSAPAALNTLTDLQQGDGAWIFVTDPDGAIWLMPGIDGPRDILLREGFNLVIWTGPDDMNIADAVAGLGGALRSISLWDAIAQQFLSFNAQLPVSLNSAQTLPHGAGMWIDVSENVTWSQPAR